MNAKEILLRWIKACPHACKPDVQKERNSRDHAQQKQRKCWKPRTCLLWNSTVAPNGLGLLNGDGLSWALVLVSEERMNSDTRQRLLRSS